MAGETKRMIDYGPGELRERAKSRRQETREDAIAELERRRDNLRGAVVPQWELEARGQKIDEWELV